MTALATEGLTLQRLATKQGLQDHWNVAATAPSVGDVLTWSGSAWVPSAAPTAASLSMFNVVTYGADPTGASDSRAAIQAAWDAMVAAGGGWLYFPQGAYRCDPSGGVGLDFNDGGDNYVISAVGATIKFQGTYTGFALRLGDQTSTTRTNFLEWHGLRLVNNGATGVTTGLEIWEVFNSSFYDLIVQGFPNEGVTLNAKGYNNRFWGCTVWLNGGIGVKDNTSGTLHYTPMWWYGGRIEGNGEDGVDLNGDQYHFIGVTFQSNATTGASFYDARVRQKSSYFVDCQFEHADPASAADERIMLYAASAAFVAVDHCVFSGNRTGANGHTGMAFDGKVEIGGHTIFRGMDTGWVGGLSTSQGNVGVVFYNTNLTNYVDANMTNYSQFGPQVAPVFRFALFTLDGAQFVATNAGSGGTNRFGADFAKAATLTVGGGVSIQLLFSESVTNNADKSARMGVLPYASSAQNAVAAVVGQVTSTTNQINIGGGTSAMQAATQVAFYTASAVNTATGTRRWEVQSGGDLVPFANNSYDIGNSGLRVAEYWGVSCDLSATATINTLVLTTALDEVYGGTGQTTYATGQILYASGTDTLAKRGIGSTGDVLTVAGGVPVWAAPSIAAASVTPGTFANGTWQFGATSTGAVLTIRWDESGDAFTIRREQDSVSPGTFAFRLRNAADSSNIATLDWAAALTVGAITGTTINGTTITASTGFSGPGSGITGISEANITDGSVLARVAGTETITGLYTFTHASGIRAHAGVALENEGGDLTGTAGYQTLYAQAGGVLKLRDGTGTVHTIATSAGVVLLNPPGSQTIQAGSQTSVNYLLALRAADATGGGTLVDSPPFRWIAQTWNGLNTETSTWAAWVDATATTPASSWRLDYEGTPLVTVSHLGTVTLGTATWETATRALLIPGAFECVIPSSAAAQERFAKVRQPNNAFGGMGVVSENDSGGNWTELSATNYGAGVPYLFLGDSRGTLGSPTATQSGDLLGIVYFNGRESASAWATGQAIVQGRATENYSGTANGAKLEFLTCANASDATALRMTLDQDGSLWMGATDATRSHKFWTNGVIEHFAGDSVFATAAYYAYAANVELRFNRAQGTRASPTALGAGATIGVLAFAGNYNTTPTYAVQARIYALTAGSWGASNRGAELFFATTDAAGTTMTTRWQMADTGEFHPFADNLYTFGTSSLRPSITYVRAFDATGVATFQAQAYCPVHDNGVQSGNFTIDWNEGNSHYVTLSNSTTSTVTFSNVQGGSVLTLVVRRSSNAAGLTWPGSVDWGAGGAPTIPTTAGEAIILTFYAHSTSEVAGMVSGTGYTLADI